MAEPLEQFTFVIRPGCVLLGKFLSLANANLEPSITFGSSVLGLVFTNLGSGILCVVLALGRRVLVTNQFGVRMGDQLNACRTASMLSVQRLVDPKY